MPEPSARHRENERLRVLVANERRDRLALVEPILAGLGHEVIARENDVEDVGAVTAQEQPDVALVGLGESSAHALDTIDTIVREAACPVIALLHARDPAFVREASKRGVFAHISDADVEDVGAVTAQEQPDVALVGLGESSAHALDTIDTIVREAACPVIALLHARDPAFVREASKRGVFAHISDADVEDWQSAIDIVVRRFAEYHELEGAFGRRAVTERAKGILMERHAIDEASAFEMLREHSRTSNRKLVDLAAAVVDGYQLLPKQPGGSTDESGATHES
jgi:AmiR/NasT family two-component response regulator